MPQPTSEVERIEKHAARKALRCAGVSLAKTNAILAALWPPMPATIEVTVTAAPTTPSPSLLDRLDRWWKGLESPEAVARRESLARLGHPPRRDRNAIDQQPWRREW